MLFGGFLKNSFIDFPGKISCVVFTYGCNLKCPYCHNPDLIRFKPGVSQEISEYSVLSFLEQRKGLIEGVVITGGEPTLQRELAYFAKKVRLLGYSIKLDTNGTGPDILANLIESDLIDYIAMDIKAVPSDYIPHLSSHDYSKEIMESIRIIKKSLKPYEFRTTCAKPFISEEKAYDIREIVNGAPLYALQRVSGKRCLDPDFCNDSSSLISDDELEKIKNIIAPYTGQCIIR